MPTARTPLLALLGPTASGKSAFALRLAERVNGEILSVDSTTVYRGFDIGSSKPSAEDRARIPHHLLDVLDPSEPFSAFHFVKLAAEAILEVAARGKTPILVGGTYFYLRALQHGMFDLPPIPATTIEAIEKEFLGEDQPATALHSELQMHDPEAAKQIHANDRYRLVRALAVFRTTGQKPSTLRPSTPALPTSQFVWMKYSMALSRHKLNAAIVNRADKMLTSGLLEETRQLLERYPDSRALESIGYKEVALFLKRQLTEKQLRNEIIEKTRQFAKRQVTWIRSDTEIRFIDDRDLDRVVLEWENLRVALGETAS